MATTVTIPGAPSMTAEQRRATFEDISKDIQIVAADTTQDAFIPARENFRIWIQRIIVYITTDAAQSMTFRDDAGTPKEIAVIEASPGDNTRWDFDFGAVGVPLGENQDLDLVLSAAGLAGNVSVIGYRAPASVIVASEGSGVQ